MGTITSLLKEIDDGDSGAESRLFAFVYDDLKQVARRQLRKQRFGLLQATALVHAAYERISDRESLSAKDRKHFFFLLSRAMHDVLVEQVRSDQALKRGRGIARVPMVEISIDQGRQRIDLMDLEAALNELKGKQPDANRVITLRFYGGLTLEETAEALDISIAATRRHWEYGKAWLHERLSR